MATNMRPPTPKILEATEAEKRQLAYKWAIFVYERYKALRNSDGRGIIAEERSDACKQLNK